MTKHIIIPTDFNISSLQPVHAAMRAHPADTVAVTLLHLVHPPDAIGDLLFRLRRTDTQYPVPQPFIQACEVLQNKYQQQLVSIRPLIRHGSTAAFLEQLLEGLQADAVFIQPDQPLSLPFRDSVDMLPLLRRCHCPVVEAAAPSRQEAARSAKFGDLLLAGH